MLKIACVAGAVLALSGCTQVSYNTQTGDASVTTFMTSRQDVVITRTTAGDVSWQAKNSDATTAIANAAAAAIDLAAKALVVAK